MMNDQEIQEGDMVKLPGGEWGEVKFIQPPLCKVRIFRRGRHRLEAYRLDSVKKPED